MRLSKSKTSMQLQPRKLRELQLALVCRVVVASSYALLVLTAGRVGPLVSGVLAVFFSENDTSIRTADFGDQATSAISRDDARLDKSWLSIGATRSHPSTPDEATVMERRAVRRPVP